jgi:hypothetical protein
MSGLKARITRVRAEVFACLIRGELRLTMLPGVGLANGGAPYDVSVEMVPFEYRMPNAPLWVTLDLNRGEVLKIEPRGSDE